MAKRLHEMEQELKTAKKDAEMYRRQSIDTNRMYFSACTENDARMATVQSQHQAVIAELQQQLLSGIEAKELEIATVSQY
jgi:hypothetical protein